MEPDKVAMLVMSSVLQAGALSERQKQLSEDEDFWQTLEDTPEDQLTEEQLGMIRALGVEPPPQRR